MMPLPNRELPAPLTQESFEQFRDLFMAAKYNPSSQLATAARERFEIAAHRRD